MWAWLRVWRQALPQPPQLDGSVSGSVQPVPHSICGAMQREAQAPATQAEPVGQALPQRPQLRASPAVSTQEPPQHARPAPLQAPPAFWQAPISMMPGPYDSDDGAAAGSMSSQPFETASTLPMGSYT